MNNEYNVDIFDRESILKYFLKQMFKSEENTDFYYGDDKKLSRTGTKNKWKTLEHNGVKFPQDYEQKYIPLIYNGKQIILSKNSEECAFLYAKYIGTDYVKNSTFNKNFFNDWKKIFSKGNEHEKNITLFDMCDFSLMKQYLDSVKGIEKEKKREKEEKIEEKLEKKPDADKIYKEANFDGKIQDVSNYRMEPPGLFIGRGKNPHIGKIKKRIYPEDVTINISKDAKIPELQDFLKKEHKWGKIVHNRKMEWLASWKDSITGKTKYLWLSHHSDLKANSDQKKFDLARKLKKKIKEITEINKKNLVHNDIKIRQISTALFFIDKLGIRVGNEKGDDSADTVGITNIRVEHISLSENNMLTLNFLGKDSIEYINTIQVDESVYKNVKEFIKDKDKYSQVFDKINSNDVNKYLQDFMKDLTAKVFRTYNASNVFQKELKKITHKHENLNLESNETKIKEILDDFIKANAKVAKLLNHQRNVKTGYKKQVDKIATTLDDLKKRLSQAKKAKNKNMKTIQKIKDNIKKYKSKKELVKEMKNISLDTSKANYIDPRIMVSFMKKHELPVDKIFSKTLQKKFAWAFSVDKDYKF